LRRRGKQDSITEIKLAREIDPRSLIINANIAWCYYLAGITTKPWSRKGTLRLDPSFGVAYGYLFGQVPRKARYRCHAKTWIEAQRFLCGLHGFVVIPAR